MIDFEKALLDPAGVFLSPANVVQAKELSRTQKIRILRRWEYDARELEVAEEENMGGPEPDILDEVFAALHELKAEINVEDNPPTKHGGDID